MSGYVNRVFAHSCEDMAEIPDGSVHTCVTSPPYWGLRDYGVDGQIGLEATPEAYVERIVAVFREVRRVLRDDGTAWLNLGDSYCNAGSSRNGEGLDRSIRGGATGADGALGYKNRDIRRSIGLKTKDLVGIPWRVAFALQTDGWWLRDAIIWHKVNPMPSSVADRCTPCYEFVFMLAKSARYFSDMDAVRTPITEESLARISQASFDSQTGGPKDYANGTNPNRSARKTIENFAKRARNKTVEDPNARGLRQAPEPGEPNAFHPLGANLRNVWTIATEGYAEAHFAVMPRELVRRCLLIGCPPQCCSECGAPYRRLIEVGELAGEAKLHEHERPAADVRRVSPTSALRTNGRTFRRRTETGFEASCDHDAPSVGGIVLDPFMGSGTTADVALASGRRFVGYELNPEYHSLITNRLGLFACSPQP